MYCKLLFIYILVMAICAKKGTSGRGTGLSELKFPLLRRKNAKMDQKRHFPEIQPRPVCKVLVMDKVSME